MRPKVPFPAKTDPATYAFDPNQPREPAGKPTGGRFVKKGQPAPTAASTPHAARPVAAHPNLVPIAGLIDGEHADHIAALAKLPAAVHARVRDAGLSAVYLGTGPVTGLDDLGHLKGKQPAGWPEGLTWDSVRGCYHRTKKAVVCGTGDEGGSHAMALHEYGHAAADLLGLEKDPEAIAWHRTLHDGLGLYFRQGGPGAKKGTEEMLAESFAVYWSRGESALAEWSHSPEYARWFAGRMKEWSGGTEATA